MRLGLGIVHVHVHMHWPKVVEGRFHAYRAISSAPISNEHWEEFMTTAIEPRRSARGFLDRFWSVKRSAFQGNSGLCILLAGALSSWAPTVGAQQCVAGSGPQSGTCCDPATDRCIAPSAVRYGVSAGEFCTSAVYVKYPPPLSCNGSFVWYADFISEDEAVQWRIGYAQAWWDANQIKTCGTPQPTAIGDWSASPPAVGQPQSRSYQLAFQMAGGNHPYSCATPTANPLISPFGVVRYIPQKPCPQGYVAANSTIDNSPVCKKLVPMEPPRRCDAGVSVGAPIVPSTGEKVRSELDWADSGPAPLSLVRYYRSVSGSSSQPAGPWGRAWNHNHSTRLRFSATSAAVTNPEGYERTFTQDPSTSGWIATNSADTLLKIGETWRYRRADSDAELTFDAAGNLVSEVSRNG
jgi:hypothetical protein